MREAKFVDGPWQGLETGLFFSEWTGPEELVMPSSPNQKNALDDVIRAAVGISNARDVVYRLSRTDREYSWYSLKP